MIELEQAESQQSSGSRRPGGDAPKRKVCPVRRGRRSQQPSAWVTYEPPLVNDRVRGRSYEEDSQSEDPPDLSESNTDSEEHHTSHSTIPPYESDTDSDDIPTLENLTDVEKVSDIPIAEQARLVRLMTQDGHSDSPYQIYYNRHSLDVKLSLIHI